jgi:Ca2+-binding RTX toxin-like protein
MVTEMGKLNAPVTSVAPADVVMSPDGTILYVAGTDGKVRAYDVASRGLIATWDVGATLAGIDVAPDGSFLIVAERLPSGAQGGSGASVVYKVSTESGAVSTYSLPANGSGFNFFDVAILADGSVLVSQEIYSGWVPLWSLDLASGNFTATAQTYTTRGRLTRSADATHVLFTPGDISSGPIHLWESGLGITHSYDLPIDSTDGYNAGVQAISLATDRIVQFTSWDANLYDGDLNFLGALPLSGMLGSNVSAALFDPTGTYLYLLSDNDDLIYQLATADWSVVRTFAVGANVGDGWLGAFGNRLQLSPDGRYFMVMTAGGVRLVENDGLANSFTGTEGADVLAGGAGNDLLHGAGGNDDLDGGTGNDTLYGAEGNDIIRGGAGNDSLHVWGLGTDQVEGGSGDRDTLLVAYDDSTFGSAVGAITMSAPVADPNGGFMGTITGDGRSITYSGIEIFAISTGSGNDEIWGGGNYDAFPNVRNFYDLGAGNDLFHGMGGTDTVHAGEGVDAFSGTMGAFGAPVIWSLQPTTAFGTHVFYTDFEVFLSLTTGTGQDHITTANLNLDDSITLGANNDSAILWNGHDIVNGGALGAGGTDSGLDTLVLNYGAATTSVHNVGVLTSNASGYSGQFGDDSTRLATFEAIDRFLIATGSAADSIATGGGNDEVRTGGGNDVVDSGGGNDLIDGGSGDDSMTGGTGNDIYVVGSLGDVVIENPGEGTDEVRTALASYVLAANVENLTATSDVAHDFRGSAGNNVITGGGGSDFIRLQDGGNDTAVGGGGNDVFLFGAALTSADQVNGGSGTDQIAIQGDYSGTAALSLGSNIVSVENIAILPGNDTRFGDAGTNFYDYSLTVLDSMVAAGVLLTVDANRLRVGEDFTFNGSAETDGSFFIYGGGGTDLLTGGAKNDVFIFGGQNQWGSGDVVTGGGGIDQLALRGNYTITFGAGQLVGVEQIGMVSAQDTRYGALGSVYSYDLTMVDANVDSIQMTVDASPLRTGETLKFDGSAEDDGSFRVFGGRDDDSIVGSQNGDILAGNGGADTVTGGGGADVFRYLSASDSTAGAMDKILDFASGTDKIDLGRIDADTLTAGDQAFSWIGSNAFSGSAGQLRAYQDGANWVVQGDTDGNGSADFVVMLSLDGPTQLGASDFVL